MEIFVNQLNKSNEKDLLGLVGEFVSIENLVAFKDFMNRSNCDSFAHSSYPIKGY